MRMTRRRVLEMGLGGASLAAGSRLLGERLFAADRPAEASRYNVLFIGVDDLRPALGCYGYSAVKTPHIDALAARGTVFGRAYCQAPSCMPSRSSLLTGLRPQTTRVLNNRAKHFRRARPDCITLPQRFTGAGGCWGMSFGKMFHTRDRRSWSADEWIPPTDFAYPIYRKPESLAVQKKQRVSRKPADWWGYSKWVRGVSWEDPDVPDNTLFDGLLADKVIEVLQTVKSKRFFLAPGFFRAHLPFIAPKRYYDLYPLDKIALPDNLEPAAGSFDWSTYHSAEARSYVGVPPGKGLLPRDIQLQLLRGYYASVSYVDAQIGRVLKALDTSGLADNTVVMLWGDHGYHFGEHGTWNKWSNFEEATRSTLIAAAPGQKRRGGRADGIVEFVDMYPTLCDLCGLTPPAGLEGVSFAPLLDDPRRAWKKAAFSQASPRACDGRTIRTDRYRLVEWRKGDEVAGVELYDHKTDPGENTNVAGRAEYAKTVADLTRRLKTGWRGELPEGVKAPG